MLVLDRLNVIVVLCMKYVYPTQLTLIVWDPLQFIPIRYMNFKILILDMLIDTIKITDTFLTEKYSTKCTLDFMFFVF